MTLYLNDTKSALDPSTHPHVVSYPYAVHIPVEDKKIISEELLCSSLNSDADSSVKLNVELLCFMEETNNTGLETTRRFINDGFRFYHREP